MTTKVVPKNIQAYLGDQFHPNWHYQLVFPSSVQTKIRSGWQLLAENVDYIFGQPLFLIGKPQSGDHTP